MSERMELSTCPCNPLMEHFCAHADYTALRTRLAAAEEQVRQWSQGYDRLLADRQGHEACVAEMKELREALDDTWDNFRRVAGEANAAEANLAAARRALEELLNYSDDPPCEASLTGECDKGYHNDHARAILNARALLAPERPRCGFQGYNTAPICALPAGHTGEHSAERPRENS